MGYPGDRIIERGLTISKELASEIYHQWEIFDLVNPIPLIPGSLETFRYARQNNIRTALLTSRNRKNIHDIFEKLDLAREFDVISTKQDCEFKKPDPQVFNFVLEKFEKRFKINKEGCIFVGDTPEDIKCGLAAGIQTLIVLTGPYWLEDIARFAIKPGNVLPSIDYLPEWIERHHN